MADPTHQAKQRNHRHAVELFLTCRQAIFTAVKEKSSVFSHGEVSHAVIPPSSIGGILSWFLVKNPERRCPPSHLYTLQHSVLEDSVY